MPVDTITKVLAANLSGQICVSGTYQDAKP